MFFHPKKNIGRIVVINGQHMTISSVVADMKSFRVQEEVNGPVVNNYNERHIEQADTLTVSFNEGATWVNIPFTKE